MRKTILVVEGPSGSGKTTFIGKLEKLFDIEAISTPWINRPRSYDGPEGEVLAFTKDLAAIGMALTQRDTEYAIVDRWVLSSFVYSCIRNRQIPDTDRLNKLIKSAWDMVDAASTSLQARFFELDFDEIRVVWLLMLPEVEEINERREGNHSRIYPYPAIPEHELYTWISDMFGPKMAVFDGNEDADTIINRLNEAVYATK
jgi:adenylate kinase family enzyme